MCWIAIVFKSNIVKTQIDYYLFYAIAVYVN